MQSLNAPLLSDAKDHSKSAEQVTCSWYIQKVCLDILSRKKGLQLWVHSPYGRLQACLKSLHSTMHELRHQQPCVALP